MNHFLFKILEFFIFSIIHYITASFSLGLNFRPLNFLRVTAKVFTLRFYFLLIYLKEHDGNGQMKHIETYYKINKITN